MKYLIIFTLLLTQSSCAGYYIKPQGHVAIDVPPVRSDGQPVTIPANAPSIAQGFRPLPPGSEYQEKTNAHEGIDIVTPAGTPVLAVANGIVVDSYFEPLFGNHLVIQHGQNEEGRTIVSKYLHLDTRLAQKDDVVRRGQKIGTLGSSGLLASYPHLHYEIKTGFGPDQIKYTPHNPHLFWADGVGVVTCFDRDRDWRDTPFNTTYPVPCEKE